MDYEDTIRHILRQLGIGQSYQGYDYVIYGILLVLEDKNRLEFVTKSLYPDIASKYRTSWRCVERNIRTVVDVAWKEGDPGLLLEITGGHADSKPHNAKFFELMYEYMTRVYGKTVVYDKAASGDEYRELYVTSCPDNCFCPETGKPCRRLMLLQRQIDELKQAQTQTGHAAASRT